MYKLLYTVIVVWAFMSSACVSYKDMLTVPDDRFTQDSIETFVNEQEEYRLNPYDLISVRIRGLDPESYTFMNLQDESGNQMMNESSLYVNGYTISDSGYIILPAIGKVAACGYTVDELQVVLQKEIDAYVNNATVIVRLLGFKVSILGEVARPSTFYTYSNQISIFEALARVGDAAEFANKNELTLIRQTDIGPSVILLNLADPNIFVSPYYFLEPNDVIYVRPLKVKSRRSNLANLSIFNTGFTGLSAVVALILLFERN